MVHFVSQIDFEAAEEIFSEFLKANGYPDKLLWSGRDDVAMMWGRLFVFGGEKLARRGQARARWMLAAERGNGIMLEAKAQTKAAAVCGAYVPLDAEDAMSRLIVVGALKLSALTNPPRTVQVQSRRVFALLKWLAARSARPSWWD